MSLSSQNWNPALGRGGPGTDDTAFFEVAEACSCAAADDRLIVASVTAASVCVPPAKTLA